MSLAQLPTAHVRNQPRLTPRGVRRGGAPTHPRVYDPEFRIAESPAASVFRAACVGGPISRDFASRVSGSSMATVNRQVSALLSADLLRERADLVDSGAVGRPRVPFEVNHEPYSTIGIHIGARVTGIVVNDLRGRILGANEIRTPDGSAGDALSLIGRSASSFAARWHRRTPLWVGVALGGRVDGSTGIVDHPRLGWRGAQVGSIVGASLGLPISVSGHVEAMAGAELLLAPSRVETPRNGTSLYFYARETTGVALTIDGKVHSPSTGPGSIAHLPTGSAIECICGRTGCLEATVSDRAVLAIAADRGVVRGSEGISALYKAAHGGNATAQKVLNDRARVLGTTLGQLRDLFNPDRVVLGGQAFTGYKAAMPHVAEAFGRASTLPDAHVAVSGFGDRVQQYAAAVVSLSRIFSDPLASMTRAVA